MADGRPLPGVAPQLVAQSLPHFDLTAPVATVAGSSPDPNAAPCAVRPSDSLHTAMRALSQGKRKRLFITDDQGALLGVLTVLDVLRYFLGGGAEGPGPGG